MSKLKAIRGMNDVLPEHSALWRHVETVCGQIFSNNLYRQIRTPILESTELFARSIGDDTDIVAKEMYVFDDRNGDSVALRPEGTASCARAGIENGLFYNQQQRLWYVGPMFRYERPQKGRYRQFHQIGAEAYGWSGPDIEAQMLAMTAQIWQQLGLVNTELEINSLGDSETRSQYRCALVDYLQKYVNDLDEDSQRRLTTNPLRILDSKNPKTRDILENAPSLADFLSDESKRDFAQLQEYLSALNISYKVNQQLVRGLDYYNNTVFEWINRDFGAQSTVCGGGRYDRLVEQLGGAPTPAFGFALGLERLVQMLQEQEDKASQVSDKKDVFIISVGEKAREQALCINQQLSINNISAQLYCGDGSIKNQFKHADKSGATLAFIIGEDEAAQSTVAIKYLLERRDQIVVSQDDVVKTVTSQLESL